MSIYGWFALGLVAGWVTKIPIFLKMYRNWEETSARHRNMIDKFHNNERIRLQELEKKLKMAADNLADVSDWIDTIPAGTTKATLIGMRVDKAIADIGEV